MFTHDSVTLLHLSDLQFGKNHWFATDFSNRDVSINTLVRRLCDDLDDLYKEEMLPKADFLVITGDLAETGMKAEFDEVSGFFDLLARHLGIRRDKVIIVPGNHDINWGSCQMYFDQCADSGQKPEEPYWPKYEAAIAANECAGYATFFKDFYKDQSEIHFTKDEPWTFFEIADLRVVVAGLNSTYRESHKDHFGWIGERQYRWFAERLARYKTKGWLRIGALHHNYKRGPGEDEANLRDADDLDRFLGDQLNLLLHGHTHACGIAWINDRLPALATGSAGVRTDARPAEMPNQYQIVRICKDGIDRWCRGYQLSKKKWGADCRCSDSGNRWHFSQAVSFAGVNHTFCEPPISLDSIRTDPQRAEEAINQLEGSEDWWEVLRWTPNYAQYLEVQGRLDDFAEVAGVGLKAAQAIEDPALQNLHAAHLGWCYFRRGDLDAAENVLRSIPEPGGRGHEDALFYRTLALVLLGKHDLSEAERYAHLALEIWEESDKQTWVARALGTLGLIAIKKKSPSNATDYFLRALVINKRESAVGRVMNLADMALLHGLQREFGEANRYLEEALDIASLEKDGDPYGYVLMRRAQVMYSQALSMLKDAADDLEEAQTVLSQAEWAFYTRDISRLKDEIARLIGDTPPSGHTSLTTVKDTFREALEYLLRERKGAEPLRKSSLDRYISQTPKVFAAISLEGAVPPPMCVQLEITNRCTTRCEMCDRWKWPKSNREMSTLDIKALLTEWAQMGVRSLVLSGGEPTAHEDFVDILAHAHRSRLRVGVLTNGIWRDQEGVAGAIAQYADWARVSMDGSNEEVYRNVRKPMGGYTAGVREIEEALQALRTAKKEHNSKCRIAIAYTIQKGNIDDVRQMVRWAEQCKALDKEPGPVVVFKLAHGTNGFLADEYELRKFSGDVLSDQRLIEHERVDLRYVKEFLDKMSLENVASGQPLTGYYKSQSYTCFTPYLFSLVDAFGDTYVCCHLYDDNGRDGSAERDNNVLGNVLKKGFRDVWQSEKYQNARLLLRKIDVEKMAPCGTCTRHYAPNAALTGIHKDIYLPLLHKKGSNEGHRRYEGIIRQHGGEVVWF